MFPCLRVTFASSAGVSGLCRGSGGSCASVASCRARRASRPRCMFQPSACVCSTVSVSCVPCRLARSVPGAAGVAAISPRVRTESAVLRCAECSLWCPRRPPALAGDDPYDPYRPVRSVRQSAAGLRNPGSRPAASARRRCPRKPRRERREAAPGHARERTRRTGTAPGKRQPSTRVRQAGTVRCGTCVVRRERYVGHGTVVAAGSGQRP